MLTTLRIKNLGLVDDLTLEFQPGFNVLTGETGAGKSMVLGALNLILGERADRSLLRHGSDSCTVEAVFDLRKWPWPWRDFLDTNGLELPADSELIVKRTLAGTGANKQFINGSPTSLQILAELGARLADLHGPHDHQSLLHASCQLDLLDDFAGLRAPRSAFASLARERLTLSRELTALDGDDAAIARHMDLLQHQVREIDAARLQPGELDALESEHARAANASRLGELAQSALACLEGEEDALLALSGRLGRALQELVRIDPDARPLLESHEQASSLLRELSLEVSRYADQVELDPVRLAELEERLGLIQQLRRKYGTTIEVILEHRQTAAAELAKLEGRDAEAERIRGELSSNTERLLQAAAKLSQARAAALPKLNKAVSKQLADLGFLKCQFEVSLASSTALPSSASPLPLSGLDTVEFLFSPNPGEPPKPLRAIASSGEMARVMLAIKTVLASVDAVPLLVFDEVDANVGGETARKVGEKMREIGNCRQVLCVTHLAPVAAAAPTHFQVAKEVRQQRTSVRVQPLQGDERVEELARMLGGFDPAIRRHAKSLLET
ncbi:MAG: DNA repair protein RecN [Verrucomicrobia bacterium]|nr:DNA repair protein RecN [Verrucomicrobiota bacterium]